MILQKCAVCPRLIKTTLGHCPEEITVLSTYLHLLFMFKYQVYCPFTFMLVINIYIFIKNTL